MVAFIYSGGHGNIFETSEFDLNRDPRCIRRRPSHCDYDKCQGGEQRERTGMHAVPDDPVAGRDPRCMMPLEYLAEVAVGSAHDDLFV